MSLELVHSAPPITTTQRVFRIQNDVWQLSKLPPDEIRGAYDYIERARDALSRILDRADNKDA